MTWKITFPDGHHEYHQPDDISIKITNGVLKNRRKSADQIFEGANKRVCAWIECEKLEIKTQYDFNDNLSEIRYSPRTQPYWCDINNNNIDGECFYFIHTLGNKVFEVIENPKYFNE